MATASSNPTTPTQESTSIIKTFCTNTNILVDKNIAEESKLKAAQEISENFESVVASSNYPAFLEHAIPRFLQYLREGEPQFVGENTTQLLRKLLLEIIHRIPTNEHLRAHYKSILSLMFHLLEIENEENVLVCLRIIIELHKQFRPTLQQEIQHFLQFVKTIYKDLPTNVKQFFDVVPISSTGFLPAEGGSGTVTSTSTPGSTPGTTPAASPLNTGDGTSSKGQQTTIPKAVNSLKVLAELPIIVVLMYQLYKQNVHSVVADFIPLIMNTIVLQPSLTARKSPSFNKEIYVDFVAAQIKTLSFLAYIIRIYQDMVNTYSQNMVGGMLGLLRYCPQEVAHLRKELLIAARHILATDLRNRFVPHIDQLFDEEVLIGTGWTTKESLRPLAYSTLADLVHHVRTHLPLPHLSLAVHMFSKNVHDDSLPVSIQTMSCKLLLNLVECIRQKSDEQGTGREILMRMLEVFVRKFQSIATHQIPAIFQKCQQISESQAQSSHGSHSTTTTEPHTPSLTSQAASQTGNQAGNQTSSSTTTGSSEKQTPTQQEPQVETPKKPPTPPVPNMFSVPDCRSMVKTLVCGVKTITWGAGSCKVPGVEASVPVSPQGHKTFLPWETQLFTRLLKYALQALDIYQVSVSPNGHFYIRAASSQQVRMKEEKEILEHFAGVFTMMNTATFKEVFSSSIEYLVERIHANYALQIIPNSFLANPNTSATFATILVRFLLKRLDEMGTNMDRSNLYLKLFKLVFGSVSLFASDNEQMLKPHLHEVVNRSMELACTSKEPYNYFLLLRALFRSIGGGSHDLLYQEFLPLLPNLLQGLNNLQSGVHRQYMKDLFVELCLTVPVRLSSLLPYLPMLMDPLVSALNGSQTLVSQGLRTLELCVDNLQPDFLYDHIQPVRAELFQALWKTLRNSNDSIAHVAFRVLGKFGGGNRRMLKEPQKLKFTAAETLGPCLSVVYPESSFPITLPVAAVIERALVILKTLSPTVAMLNQQPSSMTLDNTIFYRRQAWLVVQSFLVAMMSLEDTEALIHQLLSNPRENTPPVVGKTAVLPCSDEPTKKTFEQAITGVLVAASIKELKGEAVPFITSLVRHYTILGAAQQAGPCPIRPQAKTSGGMDVHVLIDALASVMAMEDKEFCKVGELAMAVMIETATVIMGDHYKAAQLPLLEYLSEKMCGCCYERAWFAKSGGCTAIRFLMKMMPLKWLMEHQLNFINALFFVMMDLTNEVSTGTVDSARTILENILRQCTRPDMKNDAELAAVHQKVFSTVVQHLVREIVSPNQTVRQQAQHSMSVLAEISNKTVYEIMEPHKSILEDMIPPKKHLLRHQPVNTQIALMDGNTFCTTLEPRLFTMELSVVEHKVFFTELLSLCEADDAQLNKLPCYKSVQSLTPLRISALNALSACHYIVQAREKIFTVLFKSLNSSVQEIQETAKECMKKFMDGYKIDMEHVHMTIRPLLMMLGDYRSLNTSLIQRLSHLMELFPTSFNEKLCEQLLSHLKKWIEVVVGAGAQLQPGAKVPKRVEEDLNICACIINMFHLIPAASSKLIDPVVQALLRAEKALMLEVGSPLREPTLKFLIRYPVQTIDHFLLHIADSQVNRLLMHFLNKEECRPLRACIEANSLKLVNSTFSLPQSTNEDPAVAFQKKLELQFQGILIIRVLVKFNDSWLPEHPVLIENLRRVWVSTVFQDRIKKDGIPVHRWREPKLLVKCILNFIKHRPSENVKLLFQLLRVFTIRHVPDFHFLKKFLDEDVAKNYTIKQKRNVFFQFVELFQDQNFPQDLKAKALQYVLIPMFQVSFERGEGNAIIGGPPNPEQDAADNVISVFVGKVIDPENPFGSMDAVRILLLQFSALLVEHASQHIHDAANKRQGNKLRRLMTFAWPCLLPKQCVDPSTKYHGHLLLAHIIAKFAIHKRIVLQVFHSLLKAHAVEARSVVRQALDILTPYMPARMEDDNVMLTHWTKKIIVEEGHTVAQLVHMLQLLVRHYKVYYPVRVHLIQHMVSAMHRLGFTANATIEHRKLAVDLAEVIIKWELQRIKDDQEQGGSETSSESSQSQSQPQTQSQTSTGAVKRSAEDSTQPEAKRTRSSSQSHTPRGAVLKSQAKTPLEKHHADAVVNFLLRIACQVNEPSTTMGSPGETLSRRCVALLKTALRPDVWPGVDLRVMWLDKLLVTVDQTPAANYANVCTGLEILTYLLSVLKFHLSPAGQPQQTILSIFKPLQRGIVACMTCQNSKVIRAVHALLARLMTLFPLESAVATSTYEELEVLYGNISKVICDGLTNYERATNGATSILYGPLMMLKAACMHNPSYIDRLMTPFMKALQRMHKDHITAVLGESTGASDMLILCLELIKSRLGVMNAQIRELFFIIIKTLIEKSPDSKLLRAITKIVEEWVKTKVTNLTIQHLPTLREKTLLLVRMMLNYEKRFPDDFELQAQFLELVNYVYRDEALVDTELAAKLEPAFLSGLRCIQPQIRSRFMEVFDKTMKKKLYDRLLYIFCSQNWEAMGAHYWIKQCIELLLAVSSCERPITPSSTFCMLPSVMSVLRFSDNPVAEEILNKADYRTVQATVKQEPMETEQPPCQAEDNSDKAKEKAKDKEKDKEKEKEKDANFLFQTDSSDKLIELCEKQDMSERAGELSNPSTLKALTEQHGKYLDQLREFKTASFLGALAQLCHSNSKLAHSVWVELFPQLWNLVSDRQQQVLAGEISPFMCSGSHLVQTDMFPSAVHTIMEGVTKCSPSIPLRPCILKYLGKTHNAWHRSAILLEDYASLCEGYVNPQVPQQQQQVVDYSLFEEDSADINPHETLDALAEMYSLLNEEDMWAGLWQQRCRYPETATAIAYQTQGFFEQAQTSYEQAMGKARDEHNRSPANPHSLSEYKLWENEWIKCSKELGQWDLLMEFGKTKGHANPFLVLESAWRVPDWQPMKEALAQVEISFPESMAYKLNLYRGYIAICHPEEQHLNMVEKLVEHSTAQAIRQWRRLPPVISHQHIPLLQAAQQIMELQEAAQIRAGLQPQNVGRSASLHDMKAIVKTWRNRLPMPSDNLSHWSDIFMWRHHHYQAIVGTYDGHSHSEPQSNHAMLGVHASAWAIIHYGKVARKQNLTGVCLDSLSRIHTIPSVPIVDCFQKIRQQVKCYLQMAGTMGKTELQEGLEVIESTNLKYFAKEMTAEFFALKGMFLAHIGRSEDANKAFSQAIQMHDSLVKAWALWGDYLDNLFIKDRNIQLGVSAIVCYLHACRHQNEAKCRKYLARTIWLMTYDDEKGALAEAVDKYCIGVPPVHWLPWIPQLLTCLVRREGPRILNLLCNIGRVYPQAVYFPIRTLYLTWKIEQRERHKMEAAAVALSQRNGTSTPATTTSAPSSIDTPAPSTAAPAPAVTTQAPSGAPSASKTTVAQSTTAATVTNTTSQGVAATRPAGGTVAPTSGAPPAQAGAATTTASSSTATSVTTSSTASKTMTDPGLGSSTSTTGGSQSDPGAIRATAQMWRCSKIMHMLRDLHPTLLSALEGVVDQMVWFRECWHEEVLRQLRQGLTKCYQVAFETRGDVSSARITPHTLSFVKKLVSTFGIGFEPASSVSTTFSSAASESLARRAQATAQDPVFQRLKEQFATDFDFSHPDAMGLHNLVGKLKKWIKILEEKAKLLPSSFLLEERCRFLSNFTTSTAEVELPGEFLMPKANTHSPYYIRIARFMPRVELVQKHNFSARRLFIRGNNGKIYPYLVMNDACMTESRREERILQLLRLINLYLEKRKESCRRHLLFTVPRVVAVSPQMRLIEDNPSSISLREILTKRCDRKHMESDAPVALYYERLAAVQLRGCQVTHQVLRDILREVQGTMVPEVLLKQWAQYTYQDATDYWTFRKQFTSQLALIGFAEFTLHLTRLGPEMLQVVQDSGRVTVGYFRFEVDDSKGELDANRPVPFRLTPNVAEFITPVGVSGVITSSMVSAARCLVEPQFGIQSILRAVLRDEMIAWHKKKQEETQLLSHTTPPADMDSELLITMVTGAVNAVTTRLQNLAQYEGGETKVSTLIAAATSPDNLCRMDPAWHPWL